MQPLVGEACATGYTSMVVPPPRTPASATRESLPQTGCAETSRASIPGDRPDPKGFWLISSGSVGDHSTVYLSRRCTGSGSGSRFRLACRDW
jgi:hypothetical protein